MFCMNSSGVSTWLASWMKWAAFSASSLKITPLLARIATGQPCSSAQPVTSWVPYAGLNSSKREPSTTRAITSRASNGIRRSWEAIPSSSSGSWTGSAPAPRGSGPRLRQFRLRTISRPIRAASASSAAMNSETPEIRECISAPPSASSSASSPVAIFTSGGPPRKISPCSRTITT